VHRVIGSAARATLTSATLVAAGPVGVVGHQGGWDEALLVAAPMAAVAWLLWLARRRVRRAEDTRADAAAQPLTRPDPPLLD